VPAPRPLLLWPLAGGYAAVVDARGGC
jgi:hypothetical protein